jgi:multidrug transporter EmrE-like cation transporter
MSLSMFFVVITSVSLNAVAHVLLRKAMLGVNGSIFGGNACRALLGIAFNPYLDVGMLCYGISILIWLFVLSKLEVSIAYPFQSIGYVIAAIVAVQFLGEGIPMARMAGIGLICAGLVFIARSG